MTQLNRYYDRQPLVSGFLTDRLERTVPVYPADGGGYENISQQHFPNLFHFSSNLPKSSINQPAALYMHFQSIFINT